MEFMKTVHIMLQFNSVKDEVLGTLLGASSVKQQPCFLPLLTEMCLEIAALHQISPSMSAGAQSECGLGGSDLERVGR